MNVHLSAQTQTEGVEGEIPLASFKKYIAYARRLVNLNLHFWLHNRFLLNMFHCELCVRSENKYYLCLSTANAAPASLLWLQRN